MNCLRRVARNRSHSIRQKESAKIKTIYLMSHGETSRHYLIHGNCVIEKLSTQMGKNHPSATSSTIITLNPSAKQMVPMLECSPWDISGISSSTTT